MSHAAETERGGTGGGLEALFTRYRRFRLRDDDGYSRLIGQVDAFEARFARLKKRVEAEGGSMDWTEECERLHERTRQALADGYVERAWHTYHGARRALYFGVEELPDGTARLHGDAEAILAESEDNLGSWRLAAVRDLLVDDETLAKLRAGDEETVRNVSAGDPETIRRLAAGDHGAVKPTVTADELVKASELLDEQYENVHRKRRHLQRQFNQLFYLALGTTVTFLALATLAELNLGVPVVGLLERPFAATAGSGGADTGSVGFAVFVVLSGALGASLFGMRSLSNKSLSTRVPQRITSLTATVARGVIGGASALFLYVVIGSNFLSVDVTPQLLIAVGFVAGYSERLVPAAVDTVAGAVGVEEDTEEKTESGGSTTVNVTSPAPGGGLLGGGTGGGDGGSGTPGSGPGTPGSGPGTPGGSGDPSTDGGVESDADGTTGAGESADADGTDGTDTTDADETVETSDTDDAPDTR
ncbi:hypothetical protein [Salinirubrum litoreum]|uniref:Uncharacterized protein n=1 Tax=Salinirubrum litoreum TaxID=1126234 RepID=A0ABD5R7N9_9EURY|nr:hypothetical protein [Salinirubrum litoreum]